MSSSYTSRMCLFNLNYALSSCPGQLLESGVKSPKDTMPGAQLKNREVSFLTRILGRKLMIIYYDKYNLLISMIYDPNRCSASKTRLHA